MPKPAPSRPIRALVLTVAGAVAVARPCPAQQARALGEPLAFAIDQWTTRDGLPQNSVTAIAQSPDGHLWIGTFGGLARFDGASFRLIERADTLGRHVDRILSLAAAADGALWIGTEDDGLLRYQDGAYEQFTTANGLPGNAITALHIDRTGILWVGARQGGIARLAGRRFEGFADVEGVPFDHVISFLEDGGGTLWINTGDRFVTIENGRPSFARWRAATVAGAIRFALDDRAGDRWLTLADGVARVSGGTVRVFGRLAGVPAPASMVEDPGGGYWIGTDNDGLYFFDPARDRDAVRRYPLPDGRREYRVRAALVDVEGNVWFGTNANGLLRAKRNVFTTYTTAHGLSHDVATAVYQDAAGVVWAATNCWGVNALDLARHTVRTFKPRMPGDPAGDPCVFTITESPPGTMWMGTYGGGLTRIQDGRVERLGSAGLRDSVVLALFTARDGTVWAGTNSGGVAALAGGRAAAVYTTEDGLADNSVRVILETRDGALWIGTVAGLSRFAGGRFTTYRAADGLSASHVRALYQDRDGSLWIGTYGGGLNRLRGDTITAVTRQDGLADDVVSAILEDDNGYFWMSGNRGIYRVARRELVEFTEGRRGRVHSVLYGEKDGLLNAETNGGFQPAAWKDARGRLWFPTVRGVAVVDPARVTVMTRAPSVTVDEVVVDGVPDPATDGMKLGPGRPTLEFRYSGLSLTAPEHVTFRYRLEGFDDHWVEAGTRRVAYYPRLPPGHYRLVVTAANRDGVWNETGAGIRLRVTAPLWSAWWFRGTGGIGLLVVAAGLLRRRQAAARRGRAAREEFARRLIESQEHERKRIAGELHDSLGQELLVVKNRALLALKADGLNDAARAQLEQISAVASRSLEGVRGLAHHLSPYQLEHLGLTSALKTMIEAVADTAGIPIDATVENVDGLLPREREINLYRIVQEGLSNVVHHAEASRTLVHVRGEERRIAVTIADDGRGFRVERDHRGRLVGGFGLSGIAERARILGGEVNVVSAPGEGTRLELSVPVAHHPFDGGMSHAPGADS